MKNDNFADKCPSPNPLSTSLPGDIYVYESEYRLVDNIKLENNNPTCLDSLSEPIVINNWLSKMKDTTGKMSSNYPVGYNYNTNIFIVSDQSDINIIANKLANF